MKYALLVALMSGSLAVAAVPPEAHLPAKRAAVVVGANMAAAGRRDLRFAHRDADQIAAVLRDAGRFAPESVSVLRDPEPHEVLAALDKAIGQLSGSPGESLLLFYYSGHSDEQALYPGGRALPIPALLKRLDDTAVTVRVGIIDACRGGAWTRAKGIKPVEPFEVPVPLDLRSEGSVLLASSTGLEDAHEAEALAGSFFTHHLVAGLRGAADRTRDGRVTVGEVFQYAQAMTVRDTTLAAGSPQHPSFRMNLSGRDDLPMTEISESRSQLVVEQRRGPLQLVRLDTGIVVLELPEGEREARLAIPPGRYLVRRREGQRTLGREIAVTANEVARVDEANLELVGTPALAIKRFDTPPPTLNSTLPAGRWEARLAFGTNHWTKRTGAFFGPFSTGNSDFLWGQMVHVAWGITNRLQLAVLSPTLTYRFGELGAQELLLFAGLSAWAVSNTEGFTYIPGAGGELRLWTSDRSAITAKLAALAFDPTTGLTTVGRLGRNLIQASGSAGYRHTLGDVVTLNLQLGFSRNVLVNGAFARQQAAPTIAIGSLDQIGARAAPLLQFHLSERWSLDGHASIGINLAEPQLYERYLVGATFTW